MKLKLLTIVVALIAVSTPAWFDFGLGFPPGIESPKVASLKVGDLAPDLDIGQWISDGGGEHSRIGEFRKGRVYLLHFLTSWSPTCDQALLECREMQRKYGKRLQLIALSPEPRENFDKFIDFPMNPKGKETYREIIDSFCLVADPDQSVFNDYMKGTAQTELPASFVIDENGKLIWYGQGTYAREVVERVMNGSWNADSDVSTEVEMQQRRLVAVRHRIRQIHLDKGLEEALNELDKVLSSDLDLEIKTYLVGNRHVMIMELPGRRPAEELREFARTHQEHPSLLNEQAWQIAIRAPLEPIPAELVQVAVDTAKIAVKADPDNHHFQDTLARLFEIQGELDDAIAAATAAVKLSGGEAEYTNRLNRLKQLKSKSGKSL